MEKQAYFDLVSKHREKILEVERYIWAHPESGFKEWNTSAYLAKIFEEAGTDLLIGIFGEYQNENSKNVGYVSVCDEDGIHIYKSVISSNKGDMIDILSKAGAYHLIKKIKENSLLF